MWEEPLAWRILREMPFVDWRTQHVAGLTVFQLSVVEELGEHIVRLPHPTFRAEIHSVYGVVLSAVEHGYLNGARTLLPQQASCCTISKRVSNEWR